MKFVKLLIIYFIICFFSCSEKTSKKIDSKSVSIVDATNHAIKTKESSNSIDNLVEDCLETALTKMKINQVDTSAINCISNYLVYSNDESFAEEVGFRLFKFLRKRKSANEAFKSYLSNKDENFKSILKDRILSCMGIELISEDYTYQKFLKDFPLFEDSSELKGKFEEISDNYADERPR